MLFFQTLPLLTILVLYFQILKKKNSLEQTERLNMIDELFRQFMERSIDNIHLSLTPLKKTISPLIDKLQVHLDIFPERKNECKLVDQGFVNYNVCLNAQTEQRHTECDASYTIISVPNQLAKETSTGKKNKGRFELNLNENETFIIPMGIGISFVYSGFLLTHH